MLTTTTNVTDTFGLLAGLVDLDCRDDEAARGVGVDISLHARSDGQAHRMIATLAAFDDEPRVEAYPSGAVIAFKVGAVTVSLFVPLHIVGIEPFPRPEPGQLDAAAIIAQARAAA